MSPERTELLDLPDGRRIAYCLRPPADAARPTLVFLSGYASDMTGTKATAVDRWAARTGCGCLRFDYSGCGASPGDFADGTLEGWLGETLAAIDRLTRGPLLLVGSSMGGWLMLHAALGRPERAAALVGIAAAPDFTEWGYSAEDRAVLVREECFVRPGSDGAAGSITYRGFWETGQSLRLLDGPIAIECPVRLLQGDADHVVPVDVATRVLTRLRSADVQLLLIKGGDHRLSEPRQIAALERVLLSLVEPEP